MNSNDSGCRQRTKQNTSLPKLRSKYIVLTMAEPTLIRDFINTANVTELAKRLHQADPRIDAKLFLSTVQPHLPKLGLNERIELLVKTLKDFLPNDFPKAAKILIAVLDPENSQPQKNGINGFIVAPMAMYVAKYGHLHFEESMAALYEMTKRFTSEFAIRYFLDRDPGLTLKILNKWKHDKNHHVRRLVSEGTRPRLPWGMKLHQFCKDPSQIIPLLDHLKNDPELYVRRSVANNLNDISKDNPQIVVKLLKVWKKDSSKEMQQLIRHALRTLIKKGHPEALGLLGYKPLNNLRIKKFELSHKKLRLGKTLEMHLVLVSNAPKTCNVVIDYVIHHMKSNQKTSPKVFKWSNKSLPPKTPVLMTKKHSIKMITTRKYYAGRHVVEIQVNGKSIAKQAFELIV